MASTQRFRQFLRLSATEKLTVLEASIWLIVAKLMVKCLPFKWITSMLGSTEVINNQTNEFPTEIKTTIAEVSRAVQRTAAHSAVKFVCLPQAIAAKMILNRHKIPNTLYLGVEYTDNKVFKAHAWLKAGRHFVTGQAGHRNYTEITAFSHNMKPRSADKTSFQPQRQPQNRIEKE